MVRRWRRHGESTLTMLIFPSEWTRLNSTMRAVFCIENWNTETRNRILFSSNIRNSVKNSGVARVNRLNKKYRDTKWFGHVGSGTRFIPFWSTLYVKLYSGLGHRFGSWPLTIWHPQFAQLLCCDMNDVCIYIYICVYIQIHTKAWNDTMLPQHFLSNKLKTKENVVVVWLWVG